MVYAIIYRVSTCFTHPFGAAGFHPSTGVLVGQLIPLLFSSARLEIGFRMRLFSSFHMVLCNDILSECAQVKAVKQLLHVLLWPNHIEYVWFGMLYSSPGILTPIKLCFKALLLLILWRLAEFRQSWARTCVSQDPGTLANAKIIRETMVIACYCSK